MCDVPERPSVRPSSNMPLKRWSLREIIMLMLNAYAPIKFSPREMQEHLFTFCNSWRSVQSIVKKTQREKKKHMFAIQPADQVNGIDEQPGDNDGHVAVDADADVAECPICMNQLFLPTSFVLDCNHTFCITCAKRWLVDESTCPTCRVAGSVVDQLEVLDVTSCEITKCARQLGLLRDELTPLGHACLLLVRDLEVWAEHLEQLVEGGECEAITQLEVSV